MWRIWLLRAAQYLGAVAGAILLLSLLMVATRPSHGVWPIITAMAERFFGVVTGDFDRSAMLSAPAMAAVSSVAPATFELVFFGAVLALAIGIPLGFVLSASRILRISAPLLQIVTAIPIFIIALLLVWVAADIFHLSPPSHPTALPLSTALRRGDWNTAWFAHFLPVLTVGAAGAARVQISLRRAAGAAWAAPYRGGLRMMGLSSFDINLRFALPEIVAALLRDLREFVLTLISATVIAEWVFHRNGMAVLFLKGAAAADWSVVSAVLFLFALATLTIGFFGNILASLIIPEEGQ